MFSSSHQLTAKRLCFLAGGPESFGSYDDDASKTEDPKKPQQEAQLAELSQQIEGNQGNEENENPQNSQENLETNPENVPEGISEEVAEALSNTRREVTKLNPDDATEGVLLAQLVGKLPDQAAVEQMENGSPELQQEWQKEVVTPLREGLKELVPGLIS